MDMKQATGGPHNYTQHYIKLFLKIGQCWKIIRTFQRFQIRIYQNKIHKFNLKSLKLAKISPILDIENSKYEIQIQIPAKIFNEIFVFK